MIPHVHINVVNVGPIPIQPFGILVAFGVGLGVWLAARRARRLGVDPKQLRSFITCLLVFGFVGAHVFDSVVYHPWSLVLWNGASSLGAFFGGLTGALVWKYFESKHLTAIGSHFHVVRPALRARPVPILALADVVMAVFPVAWVFGRAGCALVHDHSGARAPEDSWLAVAYGAGPISRYGPIELHHGAEPRYDLGLLELAFAVPLAVAFALTWRRGRTSGWYVVAACVVYAAVRFGLGFFGLEVANQVGDGRYVGMTPAQWACLALLAFGTVLGLYLYMNPWSDAT